MHTCATISKLTEAYKFIVSGWAGDVQSFTNATTALFSARECDFLSLSLSLSLSFPPETLKCSYKLTHFSCQDEREMCGHVHMPEQRRLCQWNETFFSFFFHLKPWSVVPTVTQLACRMIVAHKAVSSWDSRTDQSLPPFPRSTNVWCIYRLDNNWSKNLLYNSCSTVTKWI